MYSQSFLSFPPTWMIHFEWTESCWSSHRWRGGGVPVTLRRPEEDSGLCSLRRKAEVRNNGTIFNVDFMAPAEGPWSASTSFSLYSFWASDNNCFSLFRLIEINEGTGAMGPRLQHHYYWLTSNSLSFPTVGENAGQSDIMVINGLWSRLCGMINFSYWWDGRSRRWSGEDQREKRKHAEESLTL